MQATEVTDGTVVTEVKPEVAPVVSGKKKLVKTGNLIVDIAQEVEAMSKVKALNEADRLAEDIEVNFFKLGGVLKLIKDNSWFEGFADFNDFVLEHFGFASRKAAYLIEIYHNLVTKQIPWEKVQDLGWTKLTKLARHLTQENVDEWVEKASKLTVMELDALLKENTGEGEKTQKATDEVVTLKFKFKPDQADIVNQALAKAKGELKTEYDTVAMENICAGFVGGNSSFVVEPPPMTDVEAFINSIGFEPILHKISEMFPEWEITVAQVGEGEEVVEVAEVTEAN